MFARCKDQENCPIAFMRKHGQLFSLAALSLFLIGFTTTVGLSSCSPLPIFYACILASMVAIGASYHKVFSSPEHMESFGSGGHFHPHNLFLNGVDVEKINRGAISIPGTSYSFTLFNSVSGFSNKEWDALVPDDKLFLGSNYLQALSKAPPQNVSQRYALLFSEDKVVGVAYFQLLTLDSNAVGADIDAKWLHRALRPVASLMGESSKEAPLRLLMCGNALLSGEYGFHYSDDIKASDAFDALGHMMKALQKQEAKEAPVPLLAIKDFSMEHPGHAESLGAWGYRRLTAEPAMAVHLKEDWKSMDDYMAAMSSKYRKRVRNARKQGADLVRKSLSADEIKTNAAMIQALFDKVVDQAGFVLATMDTAGFVQMKLAFPEDFQFTAYYLQERFVGFNITYKVGEHLDANLVGLDYDVNLSVSLYQNMLYDFVETGIAKGCKSVHMGRTALEIKSTVGAEPEELAFYCRHPNNFYNRLLAPFASVVPQTEWTQRRPFK